MVTTSVEVRSAVFVTNRETMRIVNSRRWIRGWCLSEYREGLVSPWSAAERNWIRVKKENKYWLKEKVRRPFTVRLEILNKLTLESPVSYSRDII